MNFDSGKDLHIGDIVWIKAVVESKSTIYGNTQVKYFVKPGPTGTFAPALKIINAIFLRRSKLNWLRRLLKK